MKIVFDALFHHASASRTDNKIGASGNATLSSRQNGAEGQSTAASYPSKKASQLGELALVGVAPHVGILGTLPYFEHVVAPPTEQFLQGPLH